MGCKLGLIKAVFTNELQQRLVGAGRGVLLGLVSPLLMSASIPFAAHNSPGRWAFGRTRPVRLGEMGCPT